jgi:hypothetical protein
MPARPGRLVKNQIEVPEICRRVSSECETGRFASNAIAPSELRRARESDRVPLVLHLFNSSKLFCQTEEQLSVDILAWIQSSTFVNKYIFDNTTTSFFANIDPV